MNFNKKLSFAQAFAQLKEAKEIALRFKGSETPEDAGYRIDLSFELRFKEAIEKMKSAHEQEAVDELCHLNLYLRSDLGGFIRRSPSHFERSRKSLESRFSNVGGLDPDVNRALIDLLSQQAINAEKFDFRKDSFDLAADLFTQAREALGLTVDGQKRVIDAREQAVINESRRRRNLERAQESQARLKAQQDREKKEREAEIARCVAQALELEQFSLAM